MENRSARYNGILTIESPTLGLFWGVRLGFQHGLNFGYSRIKFWVWVGLLLVGIPLIMRLNLFYVAAMKTDYSKLYFLRSGWTPEGPREDSDEALRAPSDK